MRVLVVEDDRRIASALSRELRAQSYAVDVAGNGLEGEELAKINEYDVIILDILLPKQDGWQTLINLRREKVLTPVLILSALGDALDKIKGLDHGADDYLAKPFHAGELLARVRSLTRRPTEVRTTVMEQFGLKLDVSTHKAFRNGNQIPLTAKEVALLELFMMHPQKILTREMISEHLWDMNFEPRSNVIESFVKFLRQKIDKGFDKPLIHTIRGAGYIFSDEEL